MHAAQSCVFVVSRFACCLFASITSRKQFIVAMDVQRLLPRLIFQHYKFSCSINALNVINPRGSDWLPRPISLYDISNPENFLPFDIQSTRPNPFKNNCTFLTLLEHLALLQKSSTLTLLSDSTIQTRNSAWS